MTASFAALDDEEAALQAAAPEPQPPLHARHPEHRDGDLRPRGASLPAGRLLREPVLGASNKKAKPANRVVLGADNPDGSVKKDKGRLNVVQSRATVPAPTALERTTSSPPPCR